MKRYSVEDCDWPYFHKGHCKPHFLQVQNYGKVVKKKIRKAICSVEGCKRIISGLEYCHAHYKQFKKNGKIIHKKIRKGNRR